jgi:glycogen operon protein
MWQNGELRCFGLLLNGRVMREVDEYGRPVHDDVLLLLFNAGQDPTPFILPDWPEDPLWEVLVDTAAPDGSDERAVTSEVYQLQPRSLVLLAERASDQATPLRLQSRRELVPPKQVVPTS